MVMIVKLSRSRATTPEVVPMAEEQVAQRDTAPSLDVLLAPSVLQHRYVRGVDKSLIVERPERIRAVLLGIAAAIGKDGDQHPPLPTAGESPDDDLVAKLGSLSMKTDAAVTQRYRVLHSTRSISLQPPHPAVAFTHAHADDQVTLQESAYEQARQKRKAARTQLDSLPNPALPAAPKEEGNATPTPTAVSEQKPIPTSHAAYLDHLCSNAPNQPPAPQAQKLSRPHSTHEDSENYTSPDGEGDEAMYLSEVPPHLPQGDLYLAGPRTDGEGGSAEAIRHAMGACCEAVDRVVAATSATSCSPLEEIHHQASAAAGTSLPAKRVFVLSRPPGHHCAGSTPSGFCWVNNAVVASAHAYLTHSIDRVVVLDIDLHHGNGTQTLAWRINADANKHDDARFERISSLRHAALDRLRAANRRGARVAISEQEDANIQSQAGKRALRMFYGSIHDIESYPCEDGDATLVRDASTCVEGAHGQWIWNSKYNCPNTSQD